MLAEISSTAEDHDENQLEEELAELVSSGSEDISSSTALISDDKEELDKLDQWQHQITPAPVTETRAESSSVEQRVNNEIQAHHPSIIVVFFVWMLNFFRSFFN